MLKKSMALFMDAAQMSQIYKATYEETIYFSPLSLHNFLVLISSTSEGHKAESTLEPPTAFEPRFPGLGIHCPNHQAIVPCYSMLIL